MIGERPEPHLLRAVDWFDSQGIRRDIDKVYNFKHTLDGEAREWYADYARQTYVIPPWNTLINDFSRYYSSQGRGEKNLREAWRNMSFTPATDDIEVFLRDLQECAKQLNYDDQVVITTIRTAMPQEVYGALYKMDELSEVIDFCKNYYAKSPKERLKAQSTAKLDASPFKKIQDESPPDIATTLSKLTESLNKMDLPQKPYKPTLYPSGRGRGRGRGERFQGRRSPGNQVGRLLLLLLPNVMEHRSLLVVYVFTSTKSPSGPPWNKGHQPKVRHETSVLEVPAQEQHKHSFYSSSTNTFITCSLYTVRRYRTSPGTADLRARLGWLQGSTRNGM